MWVTHVSISVVYRPISTILGMKVGLWTLMTGKILWLSYHGNGCHGDKKHPQSPIMAYYGIAFEYGRSWKDGKRTLRCELSWEPTCYHSNQQNVF